MNPRREPESNRLERIGEHVRQRALSGGEASAVGFTLVVFIFAGAGLGYLLDQYLETSYCIAIGTLLGAVIGFREMFRMTKKLTRRSALEEDEPVSRSQPYKPQEYSAPTIDTVPGAKETREAPSVKPRIFSVPPPPQASFETPRAKQTGAKPMDSADDDTTEEFIERLLDNGEEEMPDSGPGDKKK